MTLSPLYNKSVKINDSSYLKKYLAYSLLNPHWSTFQRAQHYFTSVLQQTFYFLEMKTERIEKERQRG